MYRVDGGPVLDPGAESGEIACAVLQVYSGSAEGYTTPITQEAYGALQEYGRMWAQHMGRQPRPKDPMFLVTRGLSKRASCMSVRKHATHTAWRVLSCFQQPRRQWV